GLLRHRSTGRRRDQSGETSLRGNFLRRRGTRHHRSLARQRLKAARVRMAEGFAVLDPGECVASAGERKLGPCPAVVRYPRAERGNFSKQRGRCFQKSVSFSRSFLGRGCFLQVKG